MSGPMDLLQRRLLALRDALATATPLQRKEIIEQKLSAKLRQELIWLMEKGPATDSNSISRGSSTKQRYKNPARVKANLWTMRTLKGDYFAARLHLCGVVIASKATRCVREAMQLRQRLEAMGRAAVEIPERGSFEGSFRQALAGDPDMGLNFRLVLDLRQWVGRRVHSPSTTSVDALLQLRRRLHLAPWPQLRSLWLQWMTRKRRKRWRSNGHSQAEAEHIISTAEASVLARARGAKAARRSIRVAARLERVAQQAEAALIRVASQRKRKRP